MNLLGEGDSRVVIGHLTGGGVVPTGQGDAVVDIEDAAGPAWAEDVAGGGHLVVLGVDGAGEPLSAAFDAGLRRRRGRRILAEVVGRVESSGNAPVELRIPVIRAVDDSRTGSRRGT